MEKLSQLERLFSAATDDEGLVIQEVAVKAGLLWECNCHWIGSEGQSTCDSCGECRWCGCDEEMAKECHCDCHYEGIGR